MSVNYLHGIETIESSSILPSVSEVKSAVIGIIGTAPEGPVNVPTLIQSKADAEQFGDWSEYGIASGYTLPYALQLIQEYGAGTVIAVNVFTPSTSSEATVTSENCTLSAEGKATLAHHPVTAITSVVMGENVMTQGTDYTLDAATGVLTATDFDEEDAGATVTVSYKYTQTTSNNVSDITATDIIGASSNGTRTGAQALLNCFSLFGFNPKILLAPGFSSTVAVHQALLTIATTVRAVVLIDMPDNISVSTAIAARGNAGTTLINTTSDRAYLLYPRLKHYDQQTDSDKLVPYSVSMAGLIAQTDRDLGYWHSPSNHELLNITGLECAMTSSYTDSTTDVQQLNERAITSVINAYGTGYRAYGNRLASYIGTDKGLATFITTRRVSDMIAESLEQAMSAYVDVPLTSAIINDITTVGNNFLNTLVGRGAIIGGKCYPSTTDNTAEHLSQGKLYMVYEYNPPAPLERITHTLVLTNSYYES